ncbi:hypothetical protein [Candidatus Similichlamydia laticola]|uniref:Uncharacterized protein n=1 Tax=Candidatus Similichlamydia laticola TaxID=2170265 RepID=A0A369KF59_9BACT|nr:hypothetical protein [Candidatus Similichlamydia laticola]RDB31335.1 hypothetical protein HAT2_00561 [Candidatus Similichlamydia laticola]
MRSWFPWKEAEGLRILPALRDFVSEIQNMGIRLMNCIECMRMTSEFMDIAPSARNILVAGLGECLSSDRIRLVRAFEMAIGYGQGIQKLSQMTVREAFIVPTARDYFFYVLESFEQNIEFLRVGYLLWRKLGSRLKVLFSFSPLVFVLIGSYLSFFLNRETQFFLLLAMIFLLSHWRFDRFRIPYARLFPTREIKERIVDGFLSCREGRSFLFLFVQSHKFDEEEQFLNFMTMFFHGQILCDDRKYPQRRVFRMQFMKSRLSSQFVHDILDLVRGFFLFFLRSRGHKLICG